MKPMLIDFARDANVWRFDARMPATRAAIALALVASVALAGAWQRVQTLQEERVTLELRLARLAAQQQAQAERVRSAASNGGEHADMLRKAALQRALPWEAIFRAFESAPTAGLRGAQILGGLPG